MYLDLKLFFYYALGIAAAVFIFQLLRKVFKNEEEEKIKRMFLFIFIIAGGIIFSVATYWAVIQYNSFSKILLPPYSPISYFLFYAFTRYYAPYFVSLLAGLLVFFAMRYFNKKYGEKFFEIEEPYIALLSVFLVGHPAWVFYFFSFLVIGAVFNCINFLFNGRSSRLSFYYLWLPTAIFTILISKWLTLNLVWIGQIKI